MGSTFAKTYPEIVDTIIPMFQAAQNSLAATSVTEIPLMVMRQGFLEEAYFTGNFTPLYTLDGAYGGIYNAVMEVTNQYIGDRRRKTLNMLPESSTPLTTATVWAHMTQVLQTNRYDFPFTLLYQLKEEAQSDRNHRLVLQGCIGAAENHPIAVKEALINDDVGLMRLLRQAGDEVSTQELDERDFQDIDWGAHGLPSKYISTAPLRNAGKLYGYVITALNPCRPLSEDWTQFVLDLSKQVASTVATAVTIEEAALRESKLQDQILESERQIRYMAQHSDIGMQQLSLDRKTIWANRHYLKVVGQHEDGGREHVFFEDPFLEDDQAKALDTWQQVVQGQKAQTIELRLRKTYTTPHGGTMPTTILLSAFPYIPTDGKVKSVMACMTEVSRLKWAEAFQATVARDANQAKKMQSQFTDAISHEVRNPLSAMLQLADGILASAARWQEQQDCKSDETIQTVNEITDAAKTIILCANHQKRIVDDVLTLSRMDLADMALKPTAVRLEDMVEHVLKILHADVVAHNINISLIQESSIKALALDLVTCDSLRITQILINLLSNAIKFTKLEAHRNITVRYGAASSDPRAAFPSSIKWAAQTNEQRPQHDIFSDSEWGDGEHIFLNFQIEDTGLGMDEGEMKRVFDRFEQASPQTSIKYGGSGLGLFICRNLAQKQRGGIGVASYVGKGTTLAFYVGCRRASPETATNIDPAALPKLTPPKIVADPIEDAMIHLDQKSPPKRNGFTVTVTDRTKAEQKVPSNQYHILLVEDNIINQRILSKQLTRANCKVHVANHGVEALEFLRSTTHWRDTNGVKGADLPEPIPLDIILMDLNMPVMDGLTCTTEIRALEHTGAITSHVEVIAVTANASQEQAEQAYSAGVDTILRKPFVVSELLNLIEERVGKKR